MDQLPFVTEVYKRDLRIEDYFIGYLMHPYVSLYTGRGCKSHCTFCLWPQTVGGHRYRVRSPEHVAAEIRQAKQMFPQVKEFFFDDDTFTDNLPRAEAIARELGKMGVMWSCNAKANVPRKTLEVLKDNGLRLLLVGYESGNQQILYNIKKGMRIEVARKFTQDCHELGIKIHGTFILGLPGETRETIEETIRFATDINPHTIQVSLAAPYPGTFLYNQAVENGWLDADHAELVDDSGVQIAPLHYPHLSHTEIFDNVETFYKRFYFRAPKIASHCGRDGAQPADDEAPAARRCRILPVPAGASSRGLARRPQDRGMWPASGQRSISTSTRLRRQRRCCEEGANIAGHGGDGKTWTAAWLFVLLAPRQGNSAQPAGDCLAGFERDIVTINGHRVPVDRPRGVFLAPGRPALGGARRDPKSLEGRRGSHRREMM